MRYGWWALGTILLLLGIASGASSAVAGSWGPAGDKIVIASTNLSVLIGAKADPCGATVGEGALGTKSSTWTVLPEFSDCAFTVLANEAWTASDVNSEEATLQVPKGEKALVIQVSKECTVSVEEGVTLGSAKDYVNGKNGGEDPSSLALTAQEVPVKESPAKCAGGGKPTTISANMLLINLTSLTSPIEVS